MRIGSFKSLTDSHVEVINCITVSDRSKTRCSRFSTDFVAPPFFATHFFSRLLLLARAGSVIPSPHALAKIRACPSWQTGSRSVSSFVTPGLRKVRSVFLPHPHGYFYYRPPAPSCATPVPAKPLHF